jgi:CRISPR-associated protein Csm1
MSLSPEMVEVALAALLHDVGKVYERTGRKSEKLEHLFGYSHAEFTSRFFEDLQRDEGNCGWKTISLDRIKTLAAYHHKPSDSLQQLIATADRCSAGERQKDRELASQFTYGKSLRPLLSLFSQIQLSQDKPENKPWKYTPASLNCHNERVFPVPVESQQTGEEGEEKYARLYRGFYDRMRCLRDCPPTLLVDAVLGVCRSYWSLIPSSACTGEVPDITLYDHATVTAAIACAMFACGENVKKTPDRKKMLLVSGDVSGIQDFLLDLPNQANPGTAKRLRARSFYVTMLTRAAVVMILNRLGLPSCNCLKDAGGQFTLLVHNTPESREELKNLRRTFDEWMLKEFQGRLALILSDPVEIDDTDFPGGRYREFAERLNVQTDLAKKRKFRSALQTGNVWDINAMVMDTVPPDERTERSLDERLKGIGADLTGCRYIALSRKTSGISGKSNHIDFFGSLALTLHDNGKHIMMNAPELLALFEINPNENDSPNEFADSPNKFAVPYFMTRHVPRLNREEADKLNEKKTSEEDDWRAGQVKPFELIANASQGVKYLAVLKADVDRLGQIFSCGLKEKDATISRLAVLSRLLNEFFTGVLEQRLQTESDYRNIYTEYAGGDDLLFVGPWNVILNLALDIHKQFIDYTCHNPNITLSASVVLGHAKSPISSLVWQADSLLDKAKRDDEDKRPGRNRIGIFGTMLSWKDFDFALQDGLFLYDSVEKKDISRGFPYRLLRYYQMYERTKQTEVSFRDLLWKSQLRYDMARNLSNQDRALRDRLDDMTKLDVMDRLKVAATYSLYLGR